jgi:RimJ/RimL family protein N-acetyltransferase
MYKERLVMKFTLITESDLEFVNEVRNDCAPFLHDPRTFTLEETKEWFKTKPLWWIIWKDGQRIGYFRTSNHVKRVLFIGADLHKDYRGKGFGFESYCEFLPYIFKLYDLQAVLLEVLETNERGIGLYKKVGFLELRRSRILRNGIEVESILMELKKCNIL